MASPKQGSIGLRVLLLGSLWAIPCEAQTVRTEHTLQLKPGADRPAASISDAAWLAGRWVGEGLGAAVEESWLPPSGGRMVGVFRLVRADSVQFYELVTLVEEVGSLVLRLKHFGPDLAGWEGKDESVDFPLVRHTPDTLWFDGLTIRREGEGRMKIWVALEDGGNRGREETFEYRRVADRGMKEARESSPGTGAPLSATVSARKTSRKWNRSAPNCPPVTLSPEEWKTPASGSTSIRASDRVQPETATAAGARAGSAVRRRGINLTGSSPPPRRATPRRSRAERPPRCTRRSGDRTR